MRYRLAGGEGGGGEGGDPFGGCCGRGGGGDFGGLRVMSVLLRYMRREMPDARHRFSVCGGGAMSGWIG